MFDCNRNGDIRIRETFCFRSVLELGKKKLRNCAAIAASFLMIIILQNMLFSFYSTLTLVSNTRRSPLPHFQYAAIPNE
jgi:hypothetical protein